jgi:hypothetical protein
MTDTQLTAISTIAWVIGTTTTFILLAHWSAGGSWGISSAIARGLTGWAGRNGSFAGEWSRETDLPPLESPAIDRLWAGEDDVPPIENAHQPQAFAEIEDLGERRIQ